jgi:ubiquinone/menaquinone biosynthesis C-methylase UbiE
MSNIPFYFLDPAAAFVRAAQLAGTPVGLDPIQVAAGLAELDDVQKGEIIGRGLAAGLRLHRFKRTMGLRRVERVLGILRGFQPEKTLDIGSGRGAFLWPLLDAMPDLPVTATDILEHRLRDLRSVRDGGLERLAVLEMDASRMPLEDNCFHGVTFLETLEHVSDAAAAVREAMRVARRFVIVSVPSKEDDNPEHIHLFNEGDLRKLFAAAGAERVSFQYVLNHLIAVATARSS